MLPPQFKSQYVFNPTYCGGAGTNVVGYGEPYKKFDYIMTDSGIFSVLSTPEERDGLKLDKTELCKALDQVLWPNGMPKRNQYLYLLKGPSGIGKSTFAWDMLKKDGKLMRVNRDELRLMSFARWVGCKEKYIIALQVAAATAAYNQGYNFLVDDTNLTEKHEKRWADIAETLGFRFKVIDVYRQTENASLAMCIQRDSRRHGKQRVGRPVIERQFLLGKYVEWGTKPVVFVDLDGTLFDLSHREHFHKGGTCPICKGVGTYPADCSGIQATVTCADCNGTGTVKKNHYEFMVRCVADVPVPSVVEWVRELYKTHTVCLVSGRSMDLAGDPTLESLDKNNIPFDHIFMRRGGDTRPDTTVKKEILDEILNSGLPKEQIDFVIDDRLSVVDMWRENGLKVYPVRCREVDFA